MLKAGDKLPDFTLPIAYADGRRDDVAFSSLLGRGPIVISFFPLAFTRVCTTQMCEARDNAAAYERMGAQLFGFSCDSKWANQKFAAEQQLAHGIISDPNRVVVDKIWWTQTTAGVERVPKRGYLVLDAHGVVVDSWVNDVPGAPWVGFDAVATSISKAARA